MQIAFGRKSRKDRPFQHYSKVLKQIEMTKRKRIKIFNASLMLK